MKKSDWVTTKTGGDGIVTRVARNGKTADVRWRMGNEEWVKRMPTSALIVKSSIERGGMTITDLTANEITAEGDVYGNDCKSGECS